MDWLRFFLAMYMVVLVLGNAAYIAQIGKERRPITNGDAVGQLLLGGFFFIVLLLVWQRL